MNNKHPISLFKFRVGNDNDLESLDSNYLWFPSCDALNDPFEGMACIDTSNVDCALYKQFRKAFNAKYKSQRHTCDNHLDDEQFTLKFFNENTSIMRKKISVFSASKAYQYPPPSTEPYHVIGNMALWGHYADGLRGYCIEYNVPQLNDSLGILNPNKNIGTIDVHYSEQYRPILSLKIYIPVIFESASHL